MNVFAIFVGEHWQTHVFGKHLPFWLATFVVVSQLFIYGIVNASILRDELPPNADQFLRLAQVSFITWMRRRKMAHPFSYVLWAQFT